MTLFCANKNVLPLTEKTVAEKAVIHFVPGQIWCGLSDLISITFSMRHVSTYTSGCQLEPGWVLKPGGNGAIVQHQASKARCVTGRGIIFPLTSQ